MSVQQIPNLPYVAAMVALIVILVALQRRHPRFVIGGWLFGLSFVFAGQLSGYYMATRRTYAAGHVVHLCADLLAGMVFLLYAGRPLANLRNTTQLPLLNVLPFLALSIIYGLDTVRPGPYLVCCAAAAVICVLVALRTRQHWTTPAAQLALWGLVAAFAASGNFRAATYSAQGAVYAAAALQLWDTLRPHSLGRLTVSATLALWSFCFFIHPWIFYRPGIGLMFENLWSMQKYFVTLGMLLLLLEDKAHESEHLAHHDELTGVANRRRARMHLHAAIEAGHVHIILLDLNGFKSVNDTYGHLAGDQLLRIIAQRLKSVVGSADQLARLGGDEFLILTPNHPSRLIDDVERTIAQPVEVLGHTVAVTTSIGLSTFPTDEVTGNTAEKASQLLRLADQRMYRNKLLSRDEHLAAALRFE